MQLGDVDFYVTDMQWWSPYKLETKGLVSVSVSRI